MKYVCGHDCVLYVQAIVFYELAFHFNPHCAEACNNLGVLYKDRDNLDKAVECYQVLYFVGYLHHFMSISCVLWLIRSPYLCRWLYQSNQISRSRLITLVLSTQSRFYILLRADQCFLNCISRVIEMLIPLIL